MNTCFVCYSISLLHSLSIPFLSPPRSLISSLIQSLSLSSDRLLIILLCEPMRVWKPLCKCVCVTVCALVVQLKHALACLTSEWAGFESQCRNICHQTIPLYSSPLICKTGTWSCTAHWLCLNCPLMVVVGLWVPTPPMGGTVGTSCELLARALGVCVAPAHRTCLVRTQVPWPVQECALLCVCMLHDYPFPSEGTCGQWL